MIFINGERIDLNHFNDKTYYLKYDNAHVPEKTVLTWLFDNNEEALAVMFLAEHLHERVHDLILNIPYFCNSRQDRTAASNDVFTLKYFANFINALHFSEVRTFDPHSDVTAALVNHIKIETPQKYVQAILDSNPHMYCAYPDSGSAKKYNPMFKIPYVRGIKVRNFETQKIEFFQLVGTSNGVEGYDFLIIDDICGTGHTIYNTARELKNLGANDIYVYVSHCENSILGPHINGESLLNSEYITKVYTTNSILRASHPKIEIIKEFI